MKLIIQSYSRIGIRPQNEDSIDIICNLDGTNKNLININYCSIFDGHGGGEISKTLSDPKKINISKYLCNKSSNIANSSFKNKDIIQLFSYIQEKLKNDYIKSNTMGSTALISLIYPYHNKFQLKIINLGDSRIIACNEKNMALPLSVDHKPNTYGEKKRILQQGGIIKYQKNDDPRINGMSVSRAFGDLDNKFISQKPDIFTYKLNNIKFIIMGCDGVWDVIGNQEAVDFVLEKMDELKQQGKKIADFRGKSEYNIAEKLTQYALDKGTGDNISIIIIFVYE